VEVKMKVLMGHGLARKYGDRIEKLGYQVLKTLKNDGDFKNIVDFDKGY